MKRTACMAAAFICSATLAMAQNPATTTSSSASTTAGNDKITVSGCLQGDSQSSSTTASTSSTSSAGMGHFVLMTSSAASDTTAGRTGSTAGTTGSTSTTATTADKNDSSMHGVSYTLDGRDSELKNHVGHRIEVTGTVENHDSHGAASGATSTTTSGSASSRMSAGAQTLKVSSVRMISANCSAK